MTYVVTAACSGCRFTECVNVCPVDCFYELPDMLVINPDECIDCGVCVKECPTEAIVADTDIAPEMKHYIEFNRANSQKWPNLINSKDPLATDVSVVNPLARAALIGLREPSVEVIRQALRDDSYTVRSAALNTLQHSALDLSADQISELLSDPDADVRAAMCRRKDLVLNSLQTERGLQDSDPSVRFGFLKRTISLSPEQIERGLQDSDPGVRSEFLSRASFLSPEQFETGLASEDAYVRSAFAKRIDCTINKHQRCRGVLDPDEGVTLAFLERPDCFLTSDEFDYCMRSSSSQLRLFALKRYDGPLSEGQVKLGLSDNSSEVRHHVISRADVTLNRLQIEQALTDNDSTCRAMAASLSYFIPNEVQVRRGLIDDDALIRCAFASRADISLGKQQIEEGLKDKSSQVRAIFATRPGFRPTPTQLERGLTDSRCSVRIAFFENHYESLSRFQKRRAQKVGFSVEDPTSIDDFDDDRDPPHVTCPFCRAMITDSSDTWCEHLAFVYSPEYEEFRAEDGPAAKAKKFAKWWKKKLGTSTSCEVKRTHFKQFCQVFKLKQRGLAIDGMACGPASATSIFAFSALK